MSDQLEHVSDKYPLLFHYTTVDAFEKIYRSKTFWATHYQGLNDTSELQGFRPKLRDRILEVIHGLFARRMESDQQFTQSVQDRGGIDLVAKREAEIHSNLFHENTFGRKGFEETFVCCFCAHKTGSHEARHGLLSQWRAYGAGGGVAIALRARDIERLLDRERTAFSHPVNHIGDVTYDVDENDGEIQKLCHGVFDSLPGYFDEFYKDVPGTPRLGLEFLRSLIFATTLLKHQAFAEEREVRIVVSPRPTNSDSVFYEKLVSGRKSIRYRQKGKREFRYIELFGNLPLPIEYVIVGPSRIQNVNFQRIRDLVGSDIRLTRSETPFVG
jgi:hypothetical protein